MANGPTELARINEMIDWTVQEFEANPNDYIRALKLASLLRQRCLATGSQSDQELSMSTIRRAMALASRDPETQIDFLVELFRALVGVTRATDDGLDVQRSTVVARRIFAMVAPDHPDWREIHHDYCALALGRHQHVRDSTDIDEALRLGSSFIGNNDVNNAAGAQLLVDVGSLLAVRANIRDSPGDRDAAIDALRQGVGLLNAGDSTWLIGSIVLRESLGRRSTEGDLAEAVAIAWQLVGLTSLEDPEHVEHLRRLAGLLYKRYDTSGAEQDIRDAIAVGTQIVRAASSEPRSRAEDFHSLGSAFYRLFEHTKDQSYFLEAINARRKALATVLPGDPAKNDYLAVLAYVLNDWTQRFGEPLDLQEAIHVNRELVTRTPRDHPSRVGRLLNLHSMLSRASDINPDPRLLAEQREVAEQLAASVRSGFLKRSESGQVEQQLLANLPHPALASVALASLYEQKGSRDALDSLITGMRRMLDAAASSEELTLVLNADLARALVQRADITGEREDLEEALGLYRTLIAAARPNQAIDHYLGLTNALLLQFEMSNNPSALRDAINVGRQALTASTTDIQRAASHYVLGMALRREFERTGSLNVLEDGIQAARKAVSYMSSEDPGLPAALGSLAGNLRYRAERLQDSAGLGEAIGVMRQALEVTPREHRVRGRRLLMLSNMLAIRFTWTRARYDLDEAVEAARMAIAATPPEDPSRPRMLAGLASFLREAFDVLGDNLVLEEAIRLAEEAVRTTPDDHTEKLVRCSSLGSILARWAQATGAIEAASKAVAILRQVVDDEVPDHAFRPGYLSNLAYALEVYGDLVESRDELTQAVSYLREAVQHTANDHPDNAVYRRNLGNVLVRYSQIIGQSKPEEGLKALREAIYEFQCAAETSYGTAQIRAGAGERWGTLAGAQGDWATAYTGYAIAIDMLRRLVTRGMQRGDQERILADWSGLGPLTASAALGIPNVGKALTSLEAARGVLFGYVLDMRSDLSVLRKHSPELADRLERLSSELDRTHTAVSVGSSGPLSWLPLLQTGAEM